MPVIVDVEPGCVIADVFVIVTVKVFVWELNSQTTVAVAACPELTPEMVMVSARTFVLTPHKTSTAANEKISLPNRHMRFPPCYLALLYTRPRTAVPSEG